MQFPLLTLIPAGIPTVFHSGFTQAGALFLGQEVLVSRSRWEQCEPWTVFLVRLGRHLPWDGMASDGAQNSFWLFVLVSRSFGLPLCLEVEFFFPPTKSVGSKLENSLCWICSIKDETV